MELGKGIQQSFNLYCKNFWLLFLTGLVAGILATCTISILAGPVVGGLVILCLKLSRGEKAEFNEIFAHFDKFLPTFLIVLMMVAVYIIALIINSIPFLGFLFNLAVMPALFFIFYLAIGFAVDKNLEAVAAVKQAINCFLTNPLMNWVYALVIGIIAGLGGIVAIIPSVLIPFLGWFAMALVMPFAMIGIAFTMPIGTIGMVSAYQELSAKTTPAIQIDKKALQIASISLGVLLVLGLIFMFTGWGRWSPLPTSGPFGFNKVFGGSNPTTQSINIGGKTINVGTELPKDFPNDIPVYPNAKIGGYIGGADGKVEGSITTFETTDTPAQIATFYATNMQSQGWEVSPSDLGDMKMVGGKKDNRSITITANPTDGKTDILISIAKE